MLATDQACADFFPARIEKAKSKKSKKKLLKDSGIYDLGPFEAVYYQDKPFFLVNSNGNFSLVDSVEVSDETFYPKEKKHVPYEQIEETAHDVFVRAYRSLPTFKNKSPFKNWLSSIAVRTCYDFWRKQYRSRELPMSSLSEKQQHWLETTISDQSSRSFYEQGVQQEAKDVLGWALSTLSAEDRMVMELVYLEGLSGKEAAKLLGWSVANVKVRVFRCRKKLQKLLAKEQRSVKTQF